MCVTPWCVWRVRYSLEHARFQDMELVWLGLTSFIAHRQQIEQQFEQLSQSQRIPFPSSRHQMYALPTMQQFLCQCSAQLPQIHLG